MTKPIRIVVALVAFFATYIVARILSLMLPLGSDELIGTVLSFVVAVAVASVVWRQSRAQHEDPRRF